MEHHEGVEGLFNVLSKAQHELAMIHNKLQKEFQQVYPDHVCNIPTILHANPMKLVLRVKKVEDEVESLKQRCRHLLAAKQDLVDKAQATLVRNRSILQRLQSSTGVPVISDSDDPSYASLNQVIDEWTIQVRSRTEDESPDEPGEDINQKLFSAIVHGN